MLGQCTATQQQSSNVITPQTNIQIPFYPLLPSHIQNVTSRISTPSQGSHTTIKSITLLLKPLCPPHHTSSSLYHHHHLTQTHTQLHYIHPQDNTRENTLTQPQGSHPHNPNRTQHSSYTQTQNQLQCPHPHSTQQHCSYPHNTNRTQHSSYNIPQHKVKH